MYTDDNNSNNDKDMEKKNNIYTINDKKEMGIKTLFLTEGKIRIRQGFKAEIGEIRVIGLLIFDLIVLLTN